MFYRSIVFVGRWLTTDSNKALYTGERNVKKVETTQAAMIQWFNSSLFLCFVDKDIQVVPYNGNHPWKKSFANFANLEAFANVFLHFLSRPEFLYMRLLESRKFSRELRQRRQFAKLFFRGRFLLYGILIMHLFVMWFSWPKNHVKCSGTNISLKAHNSLANGHLNRSWRKVSSFLGHWPQAGAILLP